MVEEKFEYDPEGEEKSIATRLPYGLCKAYGIEIQAWWTPRDAWAALQGKGFVDNISDEYKEYYEKLKKERAKVARKKRSEYNKLKNKQLADLTHNPDPQYVHQDGSIAGAVKGNPMDFAEADSGNCNPWYSKGKIGYRTNCQTCVAVYFARRSGYDVRALPNLNNKNIHTLEYNTALAYINENNNIPHHKLKPYGMRTDRFLENAIKPGRIYTVEWAYGSSSNGHIITVERNSSGKLQLYDPQVNEIRTDVSNYFKEARARDVKIMDLTDYKINEKFCDKIMKKV